MNKPDGNPEARVALFQKREIRRMMHNNEWWFVITDIIAALTDAADPSDYWKKMRKRDPDLSKALQGGGQFVPPLALEFATAGRTRKDIEAQTGKPVISGGNFKALTGRRSKRLKADED